MISASNRRDRTRPAWWAPVLATGAAVFPVAHVANIGWLAIADAVIMLVALGTCSRVVDSNDTARGRLTSSQISAERSR